MLEGKVTNCVKQGQIWDLDEFQCCEAPKEVDILYSKH
jgi:hypothetical protein